MSGHRSTIVISDEQRDWLRAHPDVNLSALVREVLDVKIAAEQVQRANAERVDAILQHWYGADR